MNKIHILKLYSRESLSTMSKSKKKFYKLLLIALSSNLLTGNMLSDDSKGIVSDLEQLLEETEPAEYYDDKCESYRSYLIDSIEKNELLKFAESDFEELIVFTREILNDLIKKDVAVYERGKLQRYIDVSTFIKNIDSFVNLIGVDLNAGIYAFSPERLLWNDFKVLWNFFAKYHKEALEDWANSVDCGSEYERIHTKASVELAFISGTMERSVLVACITYTESFLYNIRMIICSNYSIFKSRLEAGNVSVLNNDKITDRQVIEDILYKIYPQLKSEIETEYEVYKDLLKLRDKYIHISVRDNGSGQPEMNELVSSSGLGLEMKLRYVMDFVEKINSTILTNDGFNLLWWKKDKTCNFAKLELFQIV